MKREGSPEHKRKDQAIEVDHQLATAHQLRHLDQLGQFPTRIKHARLHGRLADTNDFGNLFSPLSGPQMTEQLRQESSKGSRQLTVMHVQILEIDKRLRARCVANAPHSWAMLIKAAGWTEPAQRPEC